MVNIPLNLKLWCPELMVWNFYKFHLLIIMDWCFQWEINQSHPLFAINTIQGSSLKQISLYRSSYRHRWAPISCPGIQVLLFGLKLNGFHNCYLTNTYKYICIPYIYIMNRHTCTYISIIIIHMIYAWVYICIFFITLYIIKYCIVTPKIIIINKKISVDFFIYC